MYLLFVQIDRCAQKSFNGPRKKMSLRFPPFHRFSIRGVNYYVVQIRGRGVVSINPIMR